MGGAHVADADHQNPHVAHAPLPAGIDRVSPDHSVRPHGWKPPRRQASPIRRARIHEGSTGLGFVRIPGRPGSGDFDRLGFVRVSTQPGPFGKVGAHGFGPIPTGSGRIGSERPLIGPVTSFCPPGAGGGRWTGNGWARRHFSGAFGIGCAGDPASGAGRVDDRLRHSRAHACFSVFWAERAAQLGLGVRTRGGNARTPGGCAGHGGDPCWLKGGAGGSNREAFDALGQATSLTQHRFCQKAPGRLHAYDWACPTGPFLAPKSGIIAGRDPKPTSQIPLTRSPSRSKVARNVAGTGSGVSGACRFPGHGSKFGALLALRERSRVGGFEGTWMSSHQYAGP